MFKLEFFHRQLFEAPPQRRFADDVRCRRRRRDVEIFEESWQQMFLSLKIVEII